MQTTTIRVTPETHAILRSLAGSENTSIQVIVQKAVSEYRRRQILLQGNAAYAALQADPVAWAEELEERRAWETTLSDGLDSE
jgi:predicted transcriptional regulator